MGYMMLRLNPRELKLSDLDENILVFDITQSIKAFYQEDPDGDLTAAHVLAFTQRSWKVSPSHANSCKLIFAVCKTVNKQRQIVGVFKFSRDGYDKFFQSNVDDPGRMIILLEPAEDKLWRKYIGHFLPYPKQGEANPVRYYNV